MQFGFINLDVNVRLDMSAFVQMHQEAMRQVNAAHGVHTAPQLPIPKLSPPQPQQAAGGEAAKESSEPTAPRRLLQAALEKMTDEEALGFYDKLKALGVLKEQAPEPAKALAAT